MALDAASHFAVRNAMPTSWLNTSMRVAYARSPSMRALKVPPEPVLLRAWRTASLMSVDIFNEGVDVPSIDTVLMLRPTESTVIWMQQFGRGLRRSSGKPLLKVIDYIGNHRSFLMKLRSVAALANRNASSFGALRSILDEIIRRDLSLPEGCSVTYELESIEILERLLKPTRPEAAIEAFYKDFVERHGVRPTATEAFHEGYNPRSNSERSWLGFVARMNGLTKAESAAFSKSRVFLERIEKIEVSRSYTIVLLLAMIAAEAIPGAIGIRRAS